MRKVDIREDVSTAELENYQGNIYKAMRKAYKLATRIKTGKFRTISY